MMFNVNTCTCVCAGERCSGGTLGGGGEGDRGEGGEGWDGHGRRSFQVLQSWASVPRLKKKKHCMELP